MKGRFIVGGLVLLTLAAIKRPDLIRRIVDKFLALFEDRPTIRVRTGSLDVDAHRSEFAEVDRGEWEHVHGGGRPSGRPEVTVIAYGLHKQRWTMPGKKVELTYDAGGVASSVTFKARQGDYVQIKAQGNLKKISATRLQDTAPDVTITGLKVDHQPAPFAVQMFFIHL